LWLNYLCIYAVFNEQGERKMDLIGKTAMIVGAGRGIGRETAELFAKSGANLALASRNEAELFELEYKLSSHYNAQVLALAADATNEADMRQLTNETVARFGTIDFLVYAAGLGILKPFAELTATDFDVSMNVNTRGAFYVFQNVLPVMEKQKFGRVVVIPGILGRAAMANASVYAAAKFALTGMTKCLALEYKRAGIRFSLMHFGGVDSSFWDNIAMRVQRERMLTVEAAANAVFFAATQPGEGVLGELVLQPESHQL
jgi:NAD(P)-dependent dehydrogenase (short-subunit alcohol dehydrogenase family)